LWEKAGPIKAGNLFSIVYQVGVVFVGPIIFDKVEEGILILFERGPFSGKKHVH
jgi:hypothetical protein